MGSPVFLVAVVVALGIVIIGWALTALALSNANREVREIEGKIEHLRGLVLWYQDRYRTKSGTDTRWGGKYDLLSLDGGRNWYTVTSAGDNRTIAPPKPNMVS